MRARLERRTLAFAQPLPTAFGTLERRELIVLRLEAPDGAQGLGEAAPLTPYDGVELDDVEEQLGELPGLLREIGDARHPELLAAAAQRGLGPHAVSALDVALWDMAGRRAARPLAALLAPDPLAAVAVNATIAATAPDRAAELAAEAIVAGFRCLKLKVGKGDDGARLAAVRAATGPAAAIRLDANGAWSPPRAIGALRAMAGDVIELCEEPVHGVEGLRAVREALGGVPPIAMDETAAEPGAAASGATDAVCLKVAACGGVTGLLELARAARGAGSEVYLASTFDGPVGVAAGLHAAAALRVARPCGLATLALFAEPDPLPPHAGSIAVPAGPGLGVMV